MLEMENATISFVIVHIICHLYILMKSHKFSKTRPTNPALLMLTASVGNLKYEREYMCEEPLFSSHSRTESRRNDIPLQSF
jgi:hypothetical protein